MPLVNYEPTPAERTLQNMRDTLVGAKNVLTAAYNNGEMLIWQNPWGLTPQEVFDAVGTDAAELLQWKATFLPILLATGCDAHPLKPEGVIVTANQDGTVTVG